MLSPQQFKVDEAWIAFSLNKSAVFEGEKFDLVTLVDAASGKELSREWLPMVVSGSSRRKAARDLLDKALRANEQRSPQKIIVPQGALSDLIGPEAARSGIRIKSVPEYELRDFSAARIKSFNRMLERRRAGDA